MCIRDRCIPLSTNNGLYNTYRIGLFGCRAAKPAPSRSLARAPCMVAAVNEYPLVNCRSSQWMCPARIPPTPHRLRTTGLRARSSAGSSPSTSRYLASTPTANVCSNPSTVTTRRREKRPADNTSASMDSGSRSIRALVAFTDVRSPSALPRATTFQPVSESARALPIPRVPPAITTVRILGSSPRPRHQRKKAHPCHRCSRRS